MSTWILWSLCVLVLNTVLGAAVWTAIDDDKQRFLAWFKECPPSISFWAQPLALNAWPFAMWFWWKQPKENT